MSRLLPVIGRAVADFGATGVPADPLLDRFARRIRYLRVSVTDRCNYRCAYCMPESLVEHMHFQPRSALLTFEELERIVGVFARLGVRKVRLTGGEPTVRHGIVELVARLARVPGIEQLVMTTNGHLLADLAPWGLTGEPRVPEALAAGAGLVLFSGDKLLGGPQAGCLVGRTDLVGRCRTNPLARALRADKLTLAALAATLALYQDPENAIRTIPVLTMLTLHQGELSRRASRLAALCPEAVRAQTLPGESAVGGGSTLRSRRARRTSQTAHAIAAANQKRSVDTGRIQARSS